MKIPVTKLITTRVSNGEIEIIKKGDQFEVYYHNSTYMNSPFKLSNSYSLEFTPNQIASDSCVLAFISRITGSN
jgi:hypothetical protein